MTNRVTDRGSYLRECGAIMLLATVGAISLATSPSAAQDPPAPAGEAAPPARASDKRMMRLFWQDREQDTLKWADLYAAPNWTLTPAPVPAFPTLNVQRQDLVQMEFLDAVLVVGVRDDDRGRFQSGWVAVDSGVREQSHGDHSDWEYRNPSVIGSRLDAQQGNPAHLYRYDHALYVANDTLGGFTRLSRQDFTAASPQGRFYRGGGNHITLAAVGGLIAYSTWIDGAGPNAGRVDVVDLRNAQQGDPAYAFMLPTGGIHGATVNSGRVFFAPQDGICWMEPDYKLSRNGETVAVHHIALGTDPETDRPLRTGAFVNHRNWVLFVTGRGDSAALCLINAAAPKPAVVKVPILLADGLSLVTPRVVRTAAGKRLACIFQDRPEGEGQEFLTVVDLDPDGNRDFADARVIRTIAVGASKVEGHHGHHAIDFGAEGRTACLTNPGDGTISVLSLVDLRVEATLSVGGIPAALKVIGGTEESH